MSLLDLPNELILKISADLSWRDVLCLQKTTRRVRSLLSTQLIDKVARDPIWCPRALFSACNEGSGPQPPEKPSSQDPTSSKRDGGNPTVRRILKILSGTEGGYGDVLLQAVSTNNPHIVTTLLNNGADANCRDTARHYTPLHFAAVGGFARVVAQLVNRPDVNVNTRILHPLPWGPNTVEYGTPLVGAVWSGPNKNRIVRLLLTDPRLDVNLPCGGVLIRTPLYAAAGAGNARVVRMLLSDPRIDVNFGCLRDEDTPLHAAAECLGRPGCNRVFMMLVADPRVDVNVQRRRGYTPLHAVITRGGDACIKALLERDDLLINVKEDRGNTPLHMAVSRRRYSAVKGLLHKKGIDTNIRNSSHDTAFRLAQREGDMSIIELFLALGIRDWTVGEDSLL